MTEFCISFLVQKKTGSCISESFSEGQLGHFNPNHELQYYSYSKAPTPRGYLPCASFSQRMRKLRTRITEMKTSYQAVKNQSWKKMKGAPRLRTTPVLKTPYRIRAETRMIKWRVKACLLLQTKVVLLAGNPRQPVEICTILEFVPSDSLSVFQN